MRVCVSARARACVRARANPLNSLATHNRPLTVTGFSSPITSALSWDQTAQGIERSTAVRVPRCVGVHWQTITHLGRTGQGRCRGLLLIDAVCFELYCLLVMEI